MRINPRTCTLCSTPPPPSQVYACEWNPHAVIALRRNLEANSVPPSRCTVLEGDCRVGGRGKGDEGGNIA